MRHRERALTAACVGLISVLAIASAGGAQTPAATQSAPAAPAGFVGMETCTQCHEEVATKFKTTPHMSSSQQC